MEKFYKTKQVFLQIPANENYQNVFKDKFKVREVDDTIYLEEREEERNTEKAIDFLERLVDTFPIPVGIVEIKDDFLTEEEKEYDKPAFIRKPKK